MQNYKDLKVWEKAHKLTLEVYKKSNSFPREEMYGLTSQLRRASVSIPSNIAEGCGRYRTNDFAQFLQIALGSTNETEYQFLLAKDLGYLSEENYSSIEVKTNEIKAMLISFIKKVRNNELSDTEMSYETLSDL